MADTTAEERAASRTGLGVTLAGVATLIISAVGLVIGLLLIDSLTEDFGATVTVSRSAIDAIGETIDVIEDVVVGTSDSIVTAAQSAESAGSTALIAAAGLEALAQFLETRLPEDLEAIERALPAAIQTADTVDGALRALSFVGVEYSPDEPFGDSLRRVQLALSDLPEDIRLQADSLRLLIPAAEDLARDVEALSQSLTDLSAGLTGIDALTDSYQATVAEAEATVEATGDSLDRTTWLLRLMVIVLAIAGAAVGLALLAIGRAFGRFVFEDEDVVIHIDS